MQFLEDIFEDALKQDESSYVVFQRNVSTHSTYWVRDFTNIKTFIDQNNNSYKPTYFTLCCHKNEVVTKEGQYQKLYRKAKSASWLTNLFIDVDTNYARDKPDSNLPPSKEDAMRFIEELVKAKAIHEPSYIIDSGRGYHLYYILDEPISIDDETRETILNYLDVWKQFWLMLFAKKNWKVDAAIVEPARIFRVPESINEKCGLAVKVLHPPEDYDPVKFSIDGLLMFCMSAIDKAKPERESVGKREQKLLDNPKARQAIIQCALKSMNECKTTTELNDFVSYFRFCMAAKAGGLQYKDISSVLERHQDRFKPKALHKQNQVHWKTLEPTSITSATLVNYAKKIASNEFKTNWSEMSKPFKVTPQESKEKKELSIDELIDKYSVLVDRFFIVPSKSEECWFKSKEDHEFLIDLNKRAGFRSFAASTKIDIDNKETRKFFNLVSANQYERVHPVIDVIQEKDIHFKGYWNQDDFYISMPRGSGHIYDPLPNLQIDKDYIGLLANSTSLERERLLSFQIANELVVRNRCWPEIMYEPRLFIIQDSGNTGKSNAMQAVLLIVDTREGTLLTASDFTWENSINFKMCSDMKGAIWINEPKNEMDYDMVKAVTGNPTDTYAAKVKFRKTALNIQACNMFITSNKLHLVDANEDAIRRRLINAKTDPKKFKESLKHGTSISVVSKYYDYLRLQIIEETKFFLKNFSNRLTQNPDRPKMIMFRDIEKYLGLEPYVTLMDEDNEDRYSWEIEDIVAYLNDLFKFGSDTIEISTREDAWRKILNIPDHKKIQPHVIKFMRNNKHLIEEYANVFIEEFSNNAKKITVHTNDEYCRTDYEEDDTVLPFGENKYG